MALFLAAPVQAAVITGDNLGWLSGRMDGDNSGDGIDDGFSATGGATISVLDGNSYFQANTGVSGPSSPNPIPSDLLIGGGTGFLSIDPVVDYGFYSASTTPYAAGSATNLGTITVSAAGANQRAQTSVLTDSGSFSNRGLNIGDTLTGNVDLTGLDPTKEVNVYFVLTGWIPGHELYVAGFNGAVEVNASALVASAASNINPTDFGNGTVREAERVLVATITDFSDIDTLQFQVTDTGDTVIDGIIITQVPEPSVLLLSGLGSLLLLRRRRGLRS